MKTFNILLDLSIRKIVRRLLSIVGKGDPWLKTAPEVKALIGDQQYEKISAMPRFTKGQVEFEGMTVRFNDNVAFIGMIDEIFIRQNYLFIADNDKPKIIDCGANIGIGVLYLKKLYPEAEIHAFEPDTGAYECLQENVKANSLTNIHLHKQAVWTKNEDLEFYSDKSWGGGIHEKRGSTKIRVSAVDLAEFLNEKIDFLKMDIEGAESKVIGHVMEKIDANVQKFFFEWHSFNNQEQELGRLLSLLEHSGFRYHVKEASQRATPFQYIPQGPMDSQLEVYAYKL